MTGDVILFGGRNGLRMWGRFTSASKKSAGVEYRPLPNCTVVVKIDVTEDSEYFVVKFRGRYVRPSDIPQKEYVGLLD